jgi:hypothetical protein
MASAMNPMSEYLLKIQLIVTNSEFKNRHEANKYETVDIKKAGDMYVRACLKTDIFESYEYQASDIIAELVKKNLSDEQISKILMNPILIPFDVKQTLLVKYRQMYIDSYVEMNPYYSRLAGIPFVGSQTIKADEIVTIPDDFYMQYYLEGEIYRGEPIHLMSEKYQEMFINSEYYQKTLDEHPNLEYLKHIGSYAVPIHVSRPAKDGELMKVNTHKLYSSNTIFGNITVEAQIVHEFIDTYSKVREYIFGTLRGDFSAIYVNYDSFIRFLAIYMAIGQTMNSLMHKSSSMIHMNTVTANDFFSLYGLPSVIMEGNGMIDFLKHFRKILIDKGTNKCYRVKDLIGYEYTDIYTLIMVKQQVFENGVPVYVEDPENEGQYIPKQYICFRRFGTAEDNTSYFQFRDSNKTYSVEEITSGDPRWWNTPEVEQMLQDMNYTLSNSKYIQLSTHLSFTDIWWDLTIFLRGILDEKNETKNTLINSNMIINGSSEISLFDAVLSLILLMQWHLTIKFTDTDGNEIVDTMRGDMYLPNGIYNGEAACLDLLFNGLNNDGSPKDFKLGIPFQVASFDYEVRTTKPNWYNAIPNMDYLEPSTFKPMLDNILDRKTSNIASSLLEEVRLLYKYLEKKLLDSTKINQYRQVTDAYQALFLVDPERNWYDTISLDIDKSIMDQFGISITQWNILKYNIFTRDHEDIRIRFEGKNYPISFYNILNDYSYDLVISEEQPFHNQDFVDTFVKYMESHTITAVQTSTQLNSSVKSNFSNIIIDKVMLDSGASSDGPRTFESLLFLDNPSLYKYLFSIKNNADSVVLTIRSLVRALETYADNSLTGLYYASLGQEEYFRILKEVISYFKSYMVEFTKEEFIYMFDGILDNGGNSNMLKLYDEISHTTLRLIPHDSLSLHDVAHFDNSDIQADEESYAHDEPVFRLRGTYQKLLSLGYEVLYDDGKRLTHEAPVGISPDTKIVANLVETQKESSDPQTPVAYKLIINIDNLDVIPPNYVGNVR